MAALFKKEKKKDLVQQAQTWQVWLRFCVSILQ